MHANDSKWTKKPTAVRSISFSLIDAPQPDQHAVTLFCTFHCRQRLISVNYTCIGYDECWVNSSLKDSIRSLLDWPVIILELKQNGNAMHVQSRKTKHWDWDDTLILLISHLEYAGFFIPGVYFHQIADIMQLTDVAASVEIQRNK